VTVTIDLSPEEEAALRTKAQSQGVSVDQFLRSVLQQVTAESRNKTAGSGSSLGLLAKYGPAPSAGEIDENRAEMFANFPRADLP